MSRPPPSHTYVPSTVPLHSRTRAICELHAGEWDEMGVLRICVMPGHPFDSTSRLWTVGSYVVLHDMRLS
jgi:hypothetical protein